jgi:ribonucleoside-diphosphate reductase alpha chain
MTGIMEKHDLILSEDVLKKGAKIAVDTNKKMAQKININQAARVTCLKPEGTSSSMLGTSSGIHPHHAKRYIRHVQANVLEAPFQHFKKLNPQACEKSSWSANNTDEVIKFPIEVPDGAKLKNQLPAVEMLGIVKDTQKNWVQSGKNKLLCTQEYLSHNVSNTVTVKPDEWDSVTKYIYDNRKYFAGISLIPQSGDKDYPQAPFTTVYTSREIVKEYGDAALWCSGLIELGLNEFNNNLWAACDYVSMNQAKENDAESRLRFVTKMKNFAGKYFDGDIKRLTYCMKDVYNWKIYCDLFDGFKKVDYTQLSETEDNTVGIEEISCAGGACLL